MKWFFSCLPLLPYDNLCKNRAHEEKIDRMNVLRYAVVLILFLSFLSAGCSKSDAPEQIQVPIYPGATADEEVDAKFMGMSLGIVKRVITSDSYDTVMSFYKEHLAPYNPEVMTHELEDGRQTAITVVKDEKKSITVAIQESRKEGKTAISYMRVGF